jgi:hypothetical protein
MTFDALTIAGIVSAALSGGFVLATAAIQAPRWPVHRRSTSSALATRIRIHVRRPDLSVFRGAGRDRFRPLRAAAIKA